MIELMIVIVIVTIVLSLAVPSYQELLRETRRSDAKHLLYLNASRLQRCFTLEGVYNGSCVTRATSEEGYYSLSSTSTTVSFTLTASPVSGEGQEYDLKCTSFVLTNVGEKTATGSSSDECW